MGGLSIRDQGQSRMRGPQGLQWPWHTQNLETVAMARMRATAQRPPQSRQAACAPGAPSPAAGRAPRAACPPSVRMCPHLIWLWFLVPFRAAIARGPAAPTLSVGLDKLFCLLTAAWQWAGQLG